MFKRLHHRQIARVLHTLNGPLLLENRCLFGGGTAIALRFGEYRESVDIDFLVSDLASYRNLRQLLTAKAGVAAICHATAQPLALARDIRADQYGIRTVLQVDDTQIKLEIVLEGRIELALPTPADSLCGVATLTLVDMAASKLLANSDRWNDEGVFSRDLIDLAMMSLPPRTMDQAVAKAERAYGAAIRRDLTKAVERVQTREGWLEQCMKVLSIELPRALVWERIRALRKQGV